MSHKLLLHKLFNIGIQGDVLKWIKSNLFNRIESVKIDNNMSKPQKVISGVPLGSVLGPILFLIYINDIPDCVEKPSYTCLFADDANIGHILQSSDDIRIQLTLANIDKWMSTLQLELATSKCKVMRIGKCINKSNYYLNDNLLKYCTYYKDLSIIFRDNLKCYTHIFDICSKTYRISNMIFRSSFRLSFSMCILNIYTTNSRVWLFCMESSF